jgi:hypothetical protein
MKKSAFKIWRYYTFYRRVWNPVMNRAMPLSYKLYEFSDKKRKAAKERGDIKAKARWGRLRDLCWDIACGGPVTSMKVQRFFRV